MSKTIGINDKERFYLVRNETIIITFGKLESKQQLTTGQDYVESFDTEQELIDRLTEFTGDVDYYENNSMEELEY